jgi:SAM-dependent methyltransferase
VTLGGIVAGGALGLGAARVARAMADEIQRTLGRPSRVLALGEALGRALHQAGLPVIVVVSAPRRRKTGPPQLVATTSALPFADGAVDALCAAGLPAEGLPALRECARVVRPDGLVAIATAATALVRKVAPPEVMAAHMLHLHLVDIEQSEVGVTLLTSARVYALTHTTA